jgi:replication factor C subunit 2/4
MALARELLGDLFKTATLELNASDDRGLEAVRDKIKSFAALKINLPEKRHKIIILDEADSMTETAQHALRLIISDYSTTTRFALACNDSGKIIEPIQSRCSILRFSKLKNEEIEERLRRIMDNENIEYEEDGLNALIETSDGDMRYSLNNLQSTVVGFEKVTKDYVYRVIIILIIRLSIFLNQKF